MHKQIMYEYCTNLLPCYLYYTCTYTVCITHAYMYVTLLQIYCLHATCHFRTPTTSSKIISGKFSVLSVACGVQCFTKLQLPQLLTVSPRLCLSSVLFKFITNYAFGINGNLMVINLNNTELRQSRGEPYLVWNLAYAVALPSSHSPGTCSKVAHLLMESLHTFDVLGSCLASYFLW